MNQTTTIIEQPVTIKLQTPIHHGSEMIDSITLAPIKAKHLRGLSLELNMDECLTLLGRISGHPPSVIDELSFIDVQHLFEGLTDFLGTGPKTGINVSAP